MFSNMTWVITHKPSTSKMPVDCSPNNYKQHTRLGNNSQALYQQNASGLFPNQYSIYNSQASTSEMPVDCSPNKYYYKQHTQLGNNSQALY